jgi:hypothetical protein
MESMIMGQEKQALSLNSQKGFGKKYIPETVEKPIRQYLYFAFRRSLRDAESYDHASFGIPGNDERAVFLREMAERKRREAEKFYSYYKTDGYQVIKDLKKRSIISHPHYEVQVLASQMESIEDTYSFAYRKEHNNFELYSKLSGRDSNPYTKIVFDYLAHLQTGHIAFIEKKFSLVDLRRERMAAAS